MSGTPSVKIEFQTSNIIKAAENLLGFKNVIIETEFDVAGIFNSIIGMSGDGTFWERQERPCNARIEIEKCAIRDSVCVVSFRAKNDDYTKEFLTCVKVIQQIINK